MDTEELIALAERDLTDVANEVLKEVLTARGLSHDAIYKIRTRNIEKSNKEIELNERNAPIVSRIVAFFIDFFGVAAVVYVCLLPLRIFSDAAHEAAVLLLFWTYFLFRDGIPGQGIGKRIMSLRTEQLNGKSASLLNSFWRNLPHFFFVIDAVFALGKRRMRLGDMIAGTHVVRK